MNTRDTKPCPSCSRTAAKHCTSPYCRWHKCRVCQTTIGPNRAHDGNGKTVPTP